MHLPQGIIGWTVFAAGLLLVSYRLHGIDAPRQWVEWVERQFTYSINLRFIGGILLLIAAALVYFTHGTTGQNDIIKAAFIFSIVLFSITGLGLTFLQNHARHIIFASAESSDGMLRTMSVAIVLTGMGLMILPFFI